MATLYGRRWDSDSHRVGQSGRAKARGARGWQRADRRAVGLSCGWSQTPPLNSAGLASNGLRGPSPAKEVSEGKKKDDNL